MDATTLYGVWNNGNLWMLLIFTLDAALSGRQLNFKVMFIISSPSINLCLPTLCLTVWLIELYNVFYI